MNTFPNELLNKDSLTVAILDGIADAVSILDTGYNILFQNQAHKNLLGTHLGECCYIAYHCRDSVCEGCPVAMVYEDGKEHSTIRNAATRKGSTHAEIMASPLRNAAGEIIATIEIVRDVTERVLNEKERDESRQMLEDIANGISESILLISKERRILWANKTATELAGSDIIGRTCYEATHKSETPCKHPNDPCPIHDLLETGDPKCEEHTHRDKNGNEIIVEVSAYPIKNEDSEIIRFVHVSKDITERKRLEQALRDSEERYRSLIEQSVDGIFMFDVETKNILEANQSFQNLLGYGPDDISHLTIYDLVAHPKDDIDAKIQQMINMDKYFIGERNYRKKDGTLLSVEASASHIRHKGRSVFFLVFRDISQRKQLEREREKLILELQAALANVRQLSGLLPICAGCKKIRDDGGYWQQIESYIREHSEAKFTHGFCPECLTKLYPEYYDNMGGNISK
ncbi:MAG: PAS domain-containing protein [Nitrospirae bacterium]|nr:PAS domain-containing protein [Nitrospirota bacterium]